MFGLKKEKEKIRSEKNEQSRHGRGERAQVLKGTASPFRYALADMSIKFGVISCIRDKRIMEASDVIASTTRDCPRHEQLRRVL